MIDDDARADTTSETGPLDEELEEVLEDALDESIDEGAADLQETLEEALGEEGEEEEAEAAETEAAETEAAIEAELDVEDRAAVGEDAVLDVLLRRSGVLPEEAEISTGEETELPAARHAGEFVCSVCFLIKSESQLGDASRRVCRDCLDPPRSEQAA